MGIREEVIQELTGPGGLFELTTEEVLGQPAAVFSARMRSLREMVANTANFGDREFLVLEDQRHTFDDFIAQVAAAASALQQRGIGHGDRVAIFAANCPEWVVSFFAATSIGAIVSAYNGWWTTDEVDYATALSDPALVIADRPRLERSGKGDTDAPCLVIEDDWADFIAAGAGTALDDIDVPLAEDDPSVILFTSGTTGRPKGAVATHRGLIGFVQSTMMNGAVRVFAEMRTNPPADEGSAPSPPAQSVTLGTSPLFHVSGLYGTTLISMVTGGKIVYRRGRFDPEAVLQLIQDEGVTSFAALGSIGSRLVNHPRFSEFDTSSVVNVGFGGAPASPAVQDLMRQAFPNAAPAVGMGYGSSESVAVVATIGGAEYRERPTSCGRVAIGFEAEIRGPDGQALPTGQEGDIWCRSAYTMLEYWNDPESTAATINRDRWLNTGDIGFFDDDGYLYINSRARDMILRNAENIYPIEIEYRLDAHPSVAESAVFGVEHPEMGQEVKAVVVLNDAAVADADDLAAWCKEVLAPYKIPTLWEIRPIPLPRNPAGKVVKRELYS
ncbi:MAG: acyl--CoA ligase [Acidimicrobiia bacterium]|nr:acyl--CoA ligase [Acidimicrobiia bacterium]MYG73072.1 acyl--CoA ligase [Acidimicrobiia bacterium]MYH95445.1 acyl--CoA ligase [Acidimicrobiia bacterium]MYL08858.1 acyl--CoA ligase [Acidimicrobiia bacterium]